MPGGNVGPGVTVDLAAFLDDVGPVDPSTRTVRVGPGAVAAEVNRRARPSNLFLPPTPSSADRCTLGGMVANNAAGARTFKYGAVREWVRELEIVLADGRTVRLSPEAEVEPFAELRRRLRPRWSALSDAWPRVRKNSSGYALNRFVPSGDPTQLLVGSEGTLGLVTGITLELAPVPEGRGLALLAVAEPDGLLRSVRVAGEIGASACEFFGRRFIEIAELASDPRVGSLARDAFALVLVEVEGSDDEVEGALERLRRLAEVLGSELREARSPEDRARLWEVRHAASPLIAGAAERGLVSMQFIEDSVVPVPRLPDYLRSLTRILADADTDAVVFGHAGDGNVHVNPLVDVRRPRWKERVRSILEETVDLVADLGGTLAGEHGDGRVRAPFQSRIWPETAVRAFRDTKRALDPEGILNPGVILPVAGQDPLEGLEKRAGRR